MLLQGSDEYNTISARVSTLETDFQDGCSTIAAAITAKGVTTASNASPSTMANNIANIPTSTSKTIALNLDRDNTGVVVYQVTVNGSSIGAGQWWYSSAPINTFVTVWSGKIS